MKSLSNAYTEDDDYAMLVRPVSSVTPGADTPRKNRGASKVAVFSDTEHDDADSTEQADADSREEQHQTPKSPIVLPPAPVAPNNNVLTPNWDESSSSSSSSEEELKESYMGTLGGTTRGPDPDEDKEEEIEEQKQKQEEVGKKVDKEVEYVVVSNQHEEHVELVMNVLQDSNVEMTQQEIGKAEQWECPTCSVLNDERFESCHLCNAPRFTPFWDCASCGFTNSMVDSKCAICGRSQ
eukprot:CAMPEP_0197052128 /NCGR_PEP_ID=MMETSP1384-20130603/26651_1 /TAXON_ID=29189 /ORGANISM="Ammonia sp." /LENGTH=237 /DNA_ID=CAMNT_0042484785 /DNA_START=339 /DNA_END=1052 /DNA_ORIENTATION=-